MSSSASICKASSLDNWLSFYHFQIFVVVVLIKINFALLFIPKGQSSLTSHHLPSISLQKYFLALFFIALHFLLTAIQILLVD